MAKNINVILTLQDRFTKKMSAASYETLLFKRNLAGAQYISDKFAGWMHTMETAAVTAATASAAAIGGFVKSSMDEFEKFERSYNDVAGIMRKNPLSEEMHKVGEEAKWAAQQVKGINYTQAMDARKYMTLAGWNDKQVQAGYVPLLKTIRIENEEDSKVVADTITDSMAAFGVTSEKMGNFLDVAAAVQSTTNTSMLQAMDSALKMGPVLKTIGVEYKEGLELAGILANTGLKDTEGGNAIKSIYSRMIKGTGEAAEGMEEAGFSVYDKNGKLKSVSETFGGLAAAINKLPTEQARNAALGKIGGTRQVSALSEILTAYSQINTDTGKSIHESVSNAINNAGGALENLYKAKNSGYSGAMDILAADFANFKTNAGEMFAPYAVQVIEWLDGKLPEFGDWMENKLPGALEKTKSAAQELIEFVKPYIKWIWDNKESLAKGLLGAYIGMGAFRIGTGAVTAADTWAKFLNGLDKMKAAKAAVPFNEASAAMRGIIGGTSFAESAAFTGVTGSEALTAAGLTGTAAAKSGILAKLFGAKAAGTAGVSGAFAGAGGASAGSVLLPIAAIVGIFTAAYKNSDKLRESLKKLGGSLKTAGDKASGMFKAFKPMVDFIGWGFKKEFELIGNFITPAVDGIAWLVNGLGDAAEGMQILLDTFVFGDEYYEGVDTIKAKFEDLCTWITGADDDTKKFLGNSDSPLWQQMVDYTDNIKGGFGKIEEWADKADLKVQGLITTLEYLFGGKLGEKIADFKFGTGAFDTSKIAQDFTFGSGYYNSKNRYVPEGGFTVQESGVKHHALGTNYYKGGRTMINENGGEIVDLPTGSRIIPADKSKKIAEKKDGVVINVNIERFYGDDERYVDKLTDRIAGALAGVM